MTTNGVVKGSKYTEACKLLQLDGTSEINEAVLKRAFRYAAIREHPDKSNRIDANERFQNISQAHAYLLKCVARGETGINTVYSSGYYDDVEDADSDDFYYDDNYDGPDYEYAGFDDFMFDPSMFVFSFGPNGEIYIRVSTQLPKFFKPSTFHHHHHSNDPHDCHHQKQQSSFEELREDDIKSRRLNKQKQLEKKYNEYIQDKKRQKERDYEDFMERMYKHAKEKEIARKQERNKRAEMRKQNTAAQKSNNNNNNNDDDAQAKQLKDEAPLLLELAKVTGTSQDGLNGKKVRVIDFYDGMYVVEWDTLTPGMQSKQKARIKPENLRPWEDASIASKGRPRNNIYNDGGDTNLHHEGPKKLQKGSPPEGMVKMKVKCPKDKKPGDMIETKNIHDRNKKIKVMVPPNTKPGKSFFCFVAVAKAQEVRLLCAVCSRDLKNDKNSDEISVIQLRSCPHSVCSETCLRVIEGKCCLVCSRPKPTVASMQHLPYLQDLHAPETVLEKILEEYLCSCECGIATEREKMAREKLDKATEGAEKEVKKHYRRMSLKLHPDRHGEEFRPQFEIFTTARDAMTQSADLRQSYIQSMLDIVCKFDLCYLPQSHTHWIERHKEELSEETARHKTNKKAAGKRENVLQLEGGLMYSIPKKAQVYIQSNKERLIKVGLPISDEYQFISYCKKVVIVGSCDNISSSIENDDEMRRLGEISSENFHIKNGEISAQIILSEHAIWDIKWCKKIDPGDGNLVETPFSEETTVDLRSKSQLALIAHMATLKDLANRRIPFIKAMNRKQQQNGLPSSRQDIETKYWEMHGIIANGRSLQRKLRKSISDDKGDIQEKRDKEVAGLLNSLREVLNVAILEKLKLETLCESYRKKDAKKNFKAKVAKILETTSDAPDWISNSISQTDLVAMGGESNRLYQLFIEGKCHSLILDGATLLAASNRPDLFSKKQCDTLRQRSLEVEEKALLDAKQAATEARKTEEEAQKREEIEAMGNLMERYTLVQIHGLGKQIELNGKVATFMGIAPNKRYTIRLYGGKDVALKEINFTKWDESNFGNNSSSSHNISSNNADNSVEDDETEWKTETQDQVESRRTHNTKKKIGIAKNSEDLTKKKLRLKQQGAIDNTTAMKTKVKKKALSSREKQQPDSPKQNLQRRPSAIIQKCDNNDINTTKTFAKSQTQTKQQQASSNKPKKDYAKQKNLQMHPSTIIQKRSFNGASTTKTKTVTKTKQQKVSSNKQKKYAAKQINLQIHPSVIIQKRNDNDAGTTKFFAQNKTNPKQISSFKPPKNDAKHMKLQIYPSIKTKKRNKNGTGTTKPVAQNQTKQQQLSSGKGGKDTGTKGFNCKLKNKNSVGSTHPPLSSEGAELLSFVLERKSYIKCEPEAFFRWLKSEDIISLLDLKDAMDDDEYVDMAIIPHGLKKFKRAAFRKMLLDVGCSSSC